MSGVPLPDPDVALTRPFFEAAERGELAIPRCDACRRLVEACELFSHLANIGDTRSLVLHPASTTHRQLTDEQREAAGAGPDVIRLSIGLESLDDLIRDLDQALSRV